jgi:pyrroloquinoline quinone biosynthesis protein D
MPHEQQPAAGACPSIRAPYRLQWEEAQRAWVMLYPEGMVKLSASAGEILQRCTGLLTVEALITELEALFKAPQVRDDVLAFLSMAAKQGWVRMPAEEAGT